MRRRSRRQRRPARAAAARRRERRGRPRGRGLRAQGRRGLRDRRRLRPLGDRAPHGARSARADLRPARDARLGARGRHAVRAALRDGDRDDGRRRRAPGCASSRSRSTSSTARPGGRSAGSSIASASCGISRSSTRRGDCAAPDRPPVDEPPPRWSTAGARRDTARVPGRRSLPPPGFARFSCPVTCGPVSRVEPAGPFCNRRAGGGLVTGGDVLAGLSAALGLRTARSGARRSHRQTVGTLAQIGPAASRRGRLRARDPRDRPGDDRHDVPRLRRRGRARRPRLPRVRASTSRSPAGSSTTPRRSGTSRARSPARRSRTRASAPAS